jgi:hypothetical protein
MRLSQKYPTQNRAGGVAQVVQHLPSKYEALNLNPSTAKKKKKKLSNFLGDDGITLFVVLFLLGWELNTGPR